eukprot:366039-Chlamydomonas_euryale.AAC.14
MAQLHVCVKLQLWTALPPLVEWIRRGQRSYPTSTTARCRKDRKAQGSEKDRTKCMYTDACAAKSTDNLPQELQCRPQVELPTCLLISGGRQIARHHRGGTKCVHPSPL